MIESISAKTVVSMEEAVPSPRASTTVWTAPVIHSVLIALWGVLFLPLAGEAQRSSVSSAGVFLGRVLDAASGRPIPEATIQANDGRSLTGSLQSGADGRFLLPVPAPGVYRLHVIAMGYASEETRAYDVGSGDTLKVEILLDPAPLLLDSIQVSVRSSQRPLRMTEQLVHGRLLDDETGAPVVAATVRLLNPRGSTVAIVLADDEGRFRIVSPHPGSYRLQGERIGYRASESSELYLMPGDTVAVEFRLSTQAVLLDPLHVTASARPWSNRADLWSMRDFFERWSRFARPGMGDFMTRDSIAKYEGWTLNTGHMLVLNSMKVQQATPDGGVRLTGGCGPAYYVNGQRVPGVPKLAPVDLEGVEVYRSPNVPMDLAMQESPSFPCGAVVYWTRRSPGPRPNRRTLWTIVGALAVGVGFLVLAR